MATLSHRALAVVSGDKERRQWETAWQNDRTEPAEVRGPPTPLPSGTTSIRAVAESLDFAHYEGVYYRSDGEWTAYLACWLAVEHQLGEPLPDPRGDGALLAVWAGEASALRRWFRGAKRSVADAVLADECSVADARTSLLEALERRAGDRKLVVGERPTDD